MPDVPMPDMPRAFGAWNTSTSILGVEAEALGGQLAGYFGVKEGVLVRSVLSGSPAEKAGIRAGDVLIKVDGTVVSTPAEVSSSVRSARAKKVIPIQLVRERHEVSVNVEFADDHSNWDTPPADRPVRM